jgi:hypothetical protein
MMSESSLDARALVNSSPIPADAPVTRAVRFAEKIDCIVSSGTAASKSALRAILGPDFRASPVPFFLRSFERNREDRARAKLNHPLGGGTEHGDIQDAAASHAHHHEV